jgi:hypothetical protein
MPFVQANRGQIFTSRVWKPNPGTPINWAHPLAQQLVGMWLFNETPSPLGTAYDLSGNSNHGTMMGGTVSVPGKFGNVLRFDEVDSWVSTTASVAGLSQLTVSIWARTDQTSSSQEYIIAQAGNNDAFKLIWKSNEAVTFIVTNDAQNDAGAVESEELMKNSTDWFHFVGTYDGANVRLYINGELKGGPTAQTGVIETTPNYNVEFGSREGGNDLWGGDLDAPMIWNRALSASEILSLHRDPFPMFF